jgi:hypothetical protein
VVIASNIRSFYGEQKALSAAALATPDLTTIMVNAGVFPSDMPAQPVNDPFWGPEAHPTTPWGGYASVFAMGPTTFRVSYYGVTTPECMQIASGVINNSATNSGGAAPIHLITACGMLTDLTTGPLSTTGILNACNEINPSFGSCSSVEFDFNL